MDSDKLINQYEVYSPNGWMSFSGIKKTQKSSFIMITTKTCVLRCSLNHKIKVESGWKIAKDVIIGDLLNKQESDYEEVLSVSIENTPIELYDLLNVNNKEYYTNDIISHNCDFIGSSNTLISTAKLHTLTHKRPKSKSKEGLWVYEEPQPHKPYVMTVDTSRGQGKDYSAVLVFDVSDTPYKIVAKYRNNIISPMLFPTMIEALGRKYNTAYVLVEVNDIGGQVADILHYDLEYDNVLMSTNKGRSGQVLNGGFGKGQTLFGVRTTMPVKKLGCSILKSLIEQDKLLVEDEEVISELLTFVSKHNTYSADDMHTDDLVMCMVLFAWLTKQPYFKDLTNVDIRKELFEGEIKKIEEDEWFGFGFVSGIDEEPPDNNDTEKSDIWST